MFNRTTLIGRLTLDPDARTAATGRPVANLRLATNCYQGKQEDGTRREAVDYHYVVAFNHHATFAANHLRKGALVYVEGRSQTRTWEDQDGQSRQRTEVLADQILLLQKVSPPTPTATDEHPTGTREGDAPLAQAVEAESRWTAEAAAASGASPS